MLDVIIIGGGPAGLSAALVLARCRRSLVVIDNARHRNRRAVEMHGYLTRDRIPPAEFLDLARRDVQRYRVKMISGEATGAERREDGSFEVQVAGAESLRSRKLFLATGVVDLLPDLPGLDALYGSSVHHCPYCDGWEHREERLAAYGKGKAALGLAIALRTWSPDVVACTDGEPLETEDLARAARNGIAVRQERIVELIGDTRRLRQVRFESGPLLQRDALFFNTGQIQRSDLPRMLNCAFREDGGVATNNKQCTGVPGLYLAGDADRDVQFVIVAAAEGATAAVAINRELQDEESA
ncbi:MAG: NAD(P)/FAD-dependent oxidoreductase [Phycisphaerales bacterium]|nr:NAD(P)/FAD-dependent oxidoreductase [Phycisphaerales bacterium]